MEAIEAASSFHSFFPPLFLLPTHPLPASSSSAELSGATLIQGDVSSPMVLLQLIHGRDPLGGIPTPCLCLSTSAALGTVGSSPKLGMILAQKQRQDQ